MNLKPYPAYKESGIPWLGEVPEHWEVRSFGSLSRPLNQRSRPDLPLLSVVREKGVILRSSMNIEENHNYIPDDLSNYKAVHKGNLVINKMKAWQGSMGIASQDGIVSPAYFVYDLKMKNLNFGHYLLRSKPYVALYGRASNGIRVGQWDLSPNGLKRISLVIPPLHEQNAIVCYLDYMDKRIRRLINTKRKMITLLNEQKQAVIHKAVTRGLDPNVRLKPSGVEWLGDIPEHWEVRKLKFIKKPDPNSFVDGPFGSNLKSEHYVIGGDIYVIESGFITSGQFVKRKFKTITNDHFQTIKRSSCSDGDIIIAKIGARYGMAGILPYLDKPAVVSGNSLKLTVNERITSNRYVHEALLTARAFGALETIVNATAQPALTLGGLNNLSLPFPPLSEQIRLMDHLVNEIESFNTAISTIQREIELFREYHICLIADVVTGKLDVREAAANLPEEVEEEFNEAVENIAEIDITEEENYADA